MNLKVSQEEPIESSLAIKDGSSEQGIYSSLKFESNEMHNQDNSVLASLGNVCSPKTNQMDVSAISSLAIRRENWYPQNIESVQIRIESPRS